MLQFTRIQTAAILVTVLVVCGLAAPNFVSDETFWGWPDWAQRRITLAPELQGGTSALLEVDRNAVREHVLTSLRRQVRGVLHDAQINLPNHVTVRSGSVEVRPLPGDFEAALAKLRELSEQLNAVRPVEVTDAGGGLIRLTPTDAHIRQYEPLIVNRSIRILRARSHEAQATAIVEREGANRLRLQVPRLGPAELRGTVTP